MRRCRGPTRLLASWLWVSAAVVHGLFFVGVALGARPFVTDDARVVDPHACQLETWGQLGPAGDEFWALPGCNFTGNLELTAGVAVLPSADGGPPRDPAVLLQAKTVFHPLTPGGYGLGFAVGGLIDGTANPDTEVANAYAYVPLTVSLLGDRLLMHSNAGLRWEQEDGGVRGLWGVAGEFLATGPLFLLAETYGNTRERPFTQFGLRLWLVPDHVQLDTTYGLQFGEPVDDTYWVSIGLRLLSPPLY